MYLNGNEIGAADKNTPSKTITFEYTDGAELEIFDEGANSIIQFNQFTVTKLLNHHQIRCIWYGKNQKNKSLYIRSYTVRPRKIHNYNSFLWSPKTMYLNISLKYKYVSNKWILWSSSNQLFNCDNAQSWFTVSCKSLPRTIKGENQIHQKNIKIDLDYDWICLFHKNLLLCSFLWY